MYGDRILYEIVKACQTKKPDARGEGAQASPDERLDPMTAELAP